MSDGALLFLALVAAIAGMASFALGTDVHWRQLFGAKPRTGAVRGACKAVGAAFLGPSFLCCTRADPISMAFLVWPMLLAAAAAIVAAGLTVHAGRERRDLHAASRRPQLRHGGE